MSTWSSTSLRSKIESHRILYFLALLCLVVLCQLVYFNVVKWIEATRQVSFVAVPVSISIYLQIVQVIIVAPLIEEAGFRLSLKFKLNYVLLSIASIGAIMLLRTEILNLFLSFDQGLSSRIFYLGTICFFTWIFLRNARISSFLERCWEKYFYLLALFMNLGFVLLHLRRFSIDSPSHYHLGAIILSYYLILGLLYSWARVKLGFWYGFWLHAFNNSAAYFIILFASIRDKTNYFDVM